MKRNGVFVGMAAMVLAFGLVVMGCANGGPGKGTGCSSLRDGTKCTAQSGCSGKFLCQTGQGSDSDCTTSCSC